MLEQLVDEIRAGGTLETHALAARLLGPSMPRMAEQYLGQLEMFFSALVWYIDQHPERNDQCGDGDLL